jgi:chromosomal replication initiation ATPase DnaA
METLELLKKEECKLVEKLKENVYFKKLEETRRMIYHISGKPKKEKTIKISPEKIIDIVCNHFGIKVENVMGTRRDMDIVLARHTAMYLVSKICLLSYKKTGMLFGNKDHTTVIHAKNSILNRLYTEEGFIRNYSLIIKAINNVE